MSVTAKMISYMLTMAAILVLYYVAEVIGANGAISILLFGLVLGNMEFLVGRLARPIWWLIGYELDQAKFILDEFLKRINEELSFLVRTFFYVLLGLILDVSAITVGIAITGVALFGIVVMVRGLVTEVLGRITNSWTAGERFVIASMFPRGVATAVMALLPASAGIARTERSSMAVGRVEPNPAGCTAVLLVNRHRQRIPLPRVVSE